jgi:fucose permease
MLYLPVLCLLVTQGMRPKIFEIRSTGLKEVYMSVMFPVVFILPLTEASQRTVYRSVALAALACCHARRVENIYSIS